MKKKIIVFIIIVTIGFALWLVKTMRDAGEFKSLSPHSTCICVKVNNIPGPEDIAVDASAGMAYISSFDRRASMEGRILQGAIYRYRLEGKPVLTNLTADLKIKFYPHGISLYRSPDGKKYLFVINHQLKGHFVEIFEIKENVLIHRETVGGKELISPNDVAGVGPSQFYVTNDHGCIYAVGNALEDYLQLSFGNITYYDGMSFHVVADGLQYANGIWADDNSKLLFASATTGKKFYAYTRDMATGSLKQAATLDLGTGADNIDIDASGVIRIAAHPKMLTFLRHAKNSTDKAPSQILEIYSSGKASYAFKEIYLNLGDEISAASVAVGYKNRVLVGTVFDNYILDCTIRKKQQ